LRAGHALTFELDAHDELAVEVLDGEGALGSVAAALDLNSSGGTVLSIGGDEVVAGEVHVALARLDVVHE
jgi:hypothetical protein